MRAWEYARRMLDQAVPAIVPEAEQAWDQSAIRDRLDADLARAWHSRVPGSAAPECLMAGAIQSLEHRGGRIEGADALLTRGLAALEAGDFETLHRISFRLLTLLRAAPPATGADRFRSWQDFDAATAWPADAPVDVVAPAFAQAIEAAWLAQIVGGAVGTALEGYTAAAIAAAFGPIHAYVRPPNTYNDDITYELAFLDAYAAHGPGLCSADIAESWVALIPAGWSAETVALDNLRRGLAPPDSGRDGNPFAEWIGAQMRGAICGMVAPGRAREAARLAWMDAQISHAGNGILGAVFNAVLVARAFARPAMRALLTETAALFPTDTDYGEALAHALAACAAAADWRAAWAACDARWAEYNWVHVLPNAAAQVVALWFGDGDFDRTLEIAAGCGHDADCNAAQVLCAVAVAAGPGAIAARWSDPLGPDLITTMRRPARIARADLVARTLDAVRRWA